MNILLDRKVSDSLLNAFSEEREQERPYLSCEASGLSYQIILELLTKEIALWQQELVLGIVKMGKGRYESFRGRLLNIVGLESWLSQELITEEVISIEDLSVYGGCTFDLSPEEEPNKDGTFEFLVTAWGAHQNMVNNIADNLKEKTFRQGQSALKLYRF